MTNEPNGDWAKSRKRDERTHRRRSRESKTLQTNPPATESRIENVTNEPTGDGDESRKRDERTHRPRSRKSRGSDSRRGQIRSSVRRGLDKDNALPLRTIAKVLEIAADRPEMVESTGSVPCTSCLDRLYRWGVETTETRETRSTRSTNGMKPIVGCRQGAGSEFRDFVGGRPGSISRRMIQDDVTVQVGGPTPV